MEINERLKVTFPEQAPSQTFRLRVCMYDGVLSAQSGGFVFVMTTYSLPLVPAISSFLGSVLICCHSGVTVPVKEVLIDVFRCRGDWGRGVTYTWAGALCTRPRK